MWRACGGSICPTLRLYRDTLKRWELWLEITGKSIMVTILLAVWPILNNVAAVCAGLFSMVLETRIDWCHHYILRYFAEDGVLCKMLGKDRRSLEFHQNDGTEFTGSRRCCSRVFDSLSTLLTHQTDMRDKLACRLKNRYYWLLIIGFICLSIWVQEFNWLNFVSFSPLPLAHPIKLIDVGSCYAPFSSYSEYDCVSVDLCPATDVSDTIFLYFPTNVIVVSSLSDIPASRKFSNVTS